MYALALMQALTERLSCVMVFTGSMLVRCLFGAGSVVAVFSLNLLGIAYGGKTS